MMEITRAREKERVRERERGEILTEIMRERESG